MFSNQINAIAALLKSEDLQKYAYVFTGFGQALKADCLNYMEKEKATLLTYDSVKALNILEPMLSKDVDELLGGQVAEQ